MTVVEEAIHEPVSPVSNSAEPPADWQNYRSISRSAVVSFVLAGLGTLLGMLFPQLLVLCVVGAIAGLIGYRTIQTHPLEYTGTKLALTGMALSVIGLVGGIALHTYIYLTEVPEGDFVRVSFYELQPENPDAREVILPPKAAELAGKPIFIKGYVHPGVEGQGKVKHFILVPDMGTCCFGGQPKVTDMIEVRLQTDQGVAWSPSLRKLAGTFQLHPPRKVSSLSDVIYSLDASYVK